jgi:hypothetical protein
VVPKGFTGIATVCSITFDGVLIRRGIPITPIGGGVVEIEKRTPLRFTHIILYEHTTIDPLQVLISQKTTSETSVMRTGSGQSHDHQEFTELKPNSEQSWMVKQQPLQYPQVGMLTLPSRCTATPSSGSPKLSVAQIPWPQ